MRFEVLTVTKIRMSVFWLATPYGLAGRLYINVPEEHNSLHLQP
jgi:hypothetical protein